MWVREREIERGREREGYKTGRQREGDKEGEESVGERERDRRGREWVSLSDESLIIKKPI